MITTTLMKHRKLIAAIVVIALIAIYFTSTISNGWEDGAPEASIVCNIKAVTGGTLTGSTNVGDNTVLGQMVPLTTFTSNIATLDANTQYTISFAATMSTKTAKFGEALTNSISVTGKTGGSKANLNYLDAAGAITSSASVAGTAGSSSSLSIPGFVKHSYTPSAINIMGDVIDGSVFTFTISSSAADGRVSTTTATLTITVGSGGTIYLSVDTITVNVGSTMYPTGWNVPGNVNYIVITVNSGVVYIDYHSQIVDRDYQIDCPSGFSEARALLTQYLSANMITQTQYDCGIAQITALGG